MIFNGTTAYKYTIFSTYWDIFENISNTIDNDKRVDRYYIVHIMI